MSHELAVRIYYEDTDHSGVVYHANYLKYFERAREHLLGVDELVRLLDEDGIGFVVYKAAMTFRQGARFGDRLTIRTTVQRASGYRLVFDQQAWRANGEGPLVLADIELACVDRDGKLVALPASVVARLEAA